MASEATLFYDLGGVDLSIHAVTRRAGSLLDPTLVDDFVSNAAGFLEKAGTGDPRDAVLAAEPEPVVEKHEDDLPDVAAAFGDLVDLKTPFTHGHSKEVARLAKGAAEGSDSTARPPNGCTSPRSFTTWGRSASPTRSGRSRGH